MNKELTVAFVGNPNCGKTTLFNAFTGANLKVANWPGVTVEKKEGETTYKGHRIRLIDLPGTYSLTSYSIEERVSRKCIMEEEADVIINVVDASSLERNLYLTTQLLEMEKPMVVALNMMDIVEERGMEIDLHRLPEMLGSVPVIPVSARKRSGLDVLMHAAVHHYSEGASPFQIDYGEQIERQIDKTKEALESEYPELGNLRWHALKILENDGEVKKNYPIAAKEPSPENMEIQIINKKYAYIEEIVEECLFYKSEKSAATDRIDRILTHPVWGVPVFLCIMALVFFLTFTVGDALKGVFEQLLEIVSSGMRLFLQNMDASDWLVSLVVDGIIAGVGGILTFLPNIFILFLALALLEDSGYMSRVAYVMDGIMGKAGLSGKAFLPMVLGFGCTVPAIMATRTLESQRDRLKTILITPFMSCSARLPVYVLFSEIFFPKYAAVTAFSMYVIGLAAAIAVALVVHRTDRQGGDNTLLIELPEYKMPNAYTIWIYVWEKVKDYLTKAGTTIFAASIFIWFLLNFGTTGMVADVSQSFGAVIGKWLEPVLSLAGLGHWQIAVSLLSGISAKEVVVSSLCVMFGIGNANSAAGMSALHANLGALGFGPLNAYAMMVFCLLYTPCAATIATIRKETYSTKWTVGMVLFQLVFAWVCAVLIFQIGSLFL